MISAIGETTSQSSPEDININNLYSSRGLHGNPMEMCYSAPASLGRGWSDAAWQICGFSHRQEREALDLAVGDRFLPSFSMVRPARKWLRSKTTGYYVLSSVDIIRTCFLPKRTATEQQHGSISSSVGEYVAASYFAIVHSCHLYQRWSLRSSQRADSRLHDLLLMYIRWMVWSTTR